MFKAIDRWLPAYLKHPRWRRPAGVTDVMLCVCDHFEPFHETDKQGALRRMDLWKRELPKLVSAFRDADGVGPRHTFFYPIEQYDSDVISALADVCRDTGCETEIHLHHENDTEDGLRRKLAEGKAKLREHGLLGSSGAGDICFGFIHGDWALDDSHPEGKHCGVRNELTVLQSSGCYGDFTMPSMPSPTQTRIINSIYYAQDTPDARSHDRGELISVNGEVGAPRPRSGELLLVQGPLGLNWECRKMAVLPRIENGDLTGANSPRPDRLRLWLDLGIHVQGCPEWLFVKLHTHGAVSANSDMLLGDAMKQFHQYLTSELTESKGFRLHYVTARELVNIVHAAEAGRSGNAGQFRDHRYQPPPLAGDRA